MTIEKRDKSERRAETELQENGNCFVVKHRSLYLCIHCTFISFSFVQVELVWRHSVVMKSGVLFCWCAVQIGVIVQWRGYKEEEEEETKPVRLVVWWRGEEKEEEKEAEKQQKEEQKVQKGTWEKSEEEAAEETRIVFLLVLRLQWILRQWLRHIYGAGLRESPNYPLFHENCGLQTLWERGTQPCPAQVSFTRTEIYKRAVAPRVDTAMKVKNVLERAHKAKELVPIYYFIFLPDPLSLHIWYLLCAEKSLVARGALAEQFMEKSCRSSFPHAVLWVLALPSLLSSCFTQLNHVRTNQMLLLKSFCLFLYGIPLMFILWWLSRCN